MAESTENGTANGTAAAVTTPVTAATTAEVILHQFPRNQFGPSPSPFALKLETYLRLAKITYANDFTKPQSAKEGKCPWITHKNEPIADSSICVEYLKANNVGVNLNATLSPTDKAIARAFQKMVEEELNWVLALWRWVYDKDETIVKSMQANKIKEFIVARVVKSSVKKFSHGHGIGRHTQQEVMQIGQDDTRAIADFLGSKKYFMGEAVSDIDCTLFGLYAQILYLSPTCPLNTYIRDSHPNLVEYCDRLKAEVWPDWEEVCNSAKLAEKTKLKHSPSTATDATVATAITTNGTEHVVTTGKTNGTVNGTTTTTTTTKVEEKFSPTKHAGLLAEEIESTKIAALSSSFINHESATPSFITVETNGGIGDVTTNEHVAVNGHHHHTTTETTSNGGIATHCEDSSTHTITNGHGGDHCVTSAATDFGTSYDNAAVDTSYSVTTD